MRYVPTTSRKGSASADARTSGCCLDWYAATSLDEYFAQGYEAYVSHAKRGCLKETHRHTREELARRDPGLFVFLETHLDVSYESTQAMAAFWEEKGSGQTMPPEGQGADEDD